MYCIHSRARKTRNNVRLILLGHEKVDLLSAGHILVERDELIAGEETFIADFGSVAAVQLLGGLEQCGIMAN